MEEITSRIQVLAQEADPGGRARIQNALRQVLSELESPFDTLTGLFNQNLQIAAIRFGVDLGIFRALAQSDTPLDVTQLARESSASPQVLERIVNYLASNNLIEEVDGKKFSANKIAYVLSDKKTEAFVYHAFDTCGPCIQAFPDFFVETKYEDITSGLNTPFQKAFKTDLPCFTWLEKHPKLFTATQQVMTALQSADWITGLDAFEKEVSYPIAEDPETPKRPFFVDVGGGHGHQCVQVKDKYPSLAGRLVLQDLPKSVDEVPEIDGVQVMAHDFFQEQSVKGAKVYYLRRVLHDYPDVQCVKILKNIVSAMAGDSRILIDEHVLPETNIPWQATMADLCMMIMFGGKERSETQWKALAEQSGLKVSEIHTYNHTTFNSIVVLELE